MFEYYHLVKKSSNFGCRAIAYGFYYPTSDFECQNLLSGQFINLLNLALYGYAIYLKVSDEKTVQNAFIRFPGLLFDLGLSHIKMKHWP
jgi:hypothetical protein